MEGMKSVLCSRHRNHLMVNNGDEVMVETLKGKKVGLFFSAGWMRHFEAFIPQLVKVYDMLRSELEIVFVSQCAHEDDSEKEFNEQFLQMPWLAIPFSDFRSSERLTIKFGVKQIPKLIVLDENGKLMTEDGFEIIRELVGPYAILLPPIDDKEEGEEEEEENNEIGNINIVTESVKSLFMSPEKDYVITSQNQRGPVSHFEGKNILLYFCVVTSKRAPPLHLKLQQVYQRLKNDYGEQLEMIMIPLDDEDGETRLAFRANFHDARMPWYSLPLWDKRSKMLVKYFDIGAIPSVVVIGPKGDILSDNAVEAINEYGSRAYPFTAAKLDQIERIISGEAKTILERIVASEEFCNYLISRDGVKTMISNLVGKDFFLFFSGHWCELCRAFLPKLLDAYDSIKAKDKDLEIIFVSSQTEQAVFEETFSEMPWLAFPFGDQRIKMLTDFFKVEDVSKLVAIGPTMDIVATKGKELIECKGGDAYPITKELLKEMKEQVKKMAWKEKMQHLFYGYL